MYQRTWRPALDDMVKCSHENDNQYDRFAMKCTDIDDNIVGHLPMEISRITKFLIDRGASVHANVTSIRFRASPLVQGGLEIPCLVTVTTGNSFDDRVIRRYKELVSETYEEPLDPTYRGTVGNNADDDIQIKKALAKIPSSRPSSSKSGKSSKSVKLSEPGKKKVSCSILRFCQPTERYDQPDDDDGPRPPRAKKRTPICISDDESEDDN